MKPKVIRKMVLISEKDKKLWNNYVSNFEKFVLIRPKKVLSNPQIKNNKITISENENYSNQSKFFKKKRLKPDAILDLHGHSLYSGKIILHKYVINCYEKNIRNVLIVTGKGQNNKGVLKKEVPRWLNDEFLCKFLVNFNYAPKQFGGEGALFVRIKNKYKNYK